MKTVTEIQAEISRIEASLHKDGVGIIDIASDEAQKLSKLREDLGVARHLEAQATEQEAEADKELKEKQKWFNDVFNKFSVQEGRKLTVSNQARTEIGKLYQGGTLPPPETEEELMEQLAKVYGEIEQPAEKPKPAVSEELPDTAEGGGVPKKHDASEIANEQKANFLGSDATSDEFGGRNESGDFWSNWQKDSVPPEEAAK